MSKDRDQEFVKLQNASLDEKDGEIVAHGWLDVEAMNSLHTGDYQREVLETRGRKSSLQRAMEENIRLPDVLLGMRGESYSTRAQSMLLENDVFIIDGLQRISALRKYAMDNPEKASGLRIGAEVRFSTTRDSEAALFTAVNLKRRAMSPNVILRNSRGGSTGIATLYGLSMSDKNFALYGKISWNQQMSRGELMTAMNLARCAITLHRHFAPGGKYISNVGLLPRVSDNLSSAAGLQNFRANLHAFFDMMDTVWGVRGIKYTDRLTHMRNNFMVQLAGMLSDHEDFWDGSRLVIDGSHKAKLKSFPLDDPTIIRLSGAGNNAGILLYRYFVDHMNKGKQTNRYLTTRRIDAYHKNKAKKSA